MGNNMKNKCKKQDIEVKEDLNKNVNEIIKKVLKDTQKEEYIILRR